MVGRNAFSKFTLMAMVFHPANGVNVVVVRHGERAEGKGAGGAEGWARGEPSSWGQEEEEEEEEHAREGTPDHGLIWDTTACMGWAKLRCDQINGPVMRGNGCV